MIRVFDRYELIKQLSVGGFGQIYLARQVGAGGFERLAVLKALRPDVERSDRAFAMFLREARVVAKLNHPNIVAVYELDEWRGVYFIAMEHIDGANIAEVMREEIRLGQKLPLRVAAELVRQAALGLDHAHQADVVHRDISPQNIMVRRDGIAKVVDFGIASFVRRYDPVGNDRLEGKLRYMAPEQVSGRPLDGRCDQFALGVVLWEMCAARRMYAGLDRPAVLDQLEHGVKAPPIGAPRLDAIIKMMLSHDPEQRFMSCAAVAAALETYVAEIPQPAAPMVRSVLKMVLGPSKPPTPEPVTVPGLLDAAGRVCSACGTANPPTSRFCSSCGAALFADEPKKRKSLATAAPKLAVPEADLSAKANALAEMFQHAKRHGVVLGFRSLGRVHAARETLEAWTEIAHASGAEVLGVTSGVGRFLFDDPIAAILCGQRIVAAVETLHDRKASAVAAVAAGEIEVGSGPRADVRGAPVDAVDHLLELACEHARSGVFVEEATARGCRRLQAKVEDLGGERLIAVQRVPAASRAATIVGRRAEGVRLSELVRGATDGRAGALLVTGAAGLGKSALVAAAAARARQASLAVLEIEGRRWRRTGVGAAARIVRMAIEAVRGRPLETSSDAATAAWLEGLGLSEHDATAVADALAGAARIDADALRNALRRLARERPLAIIVDDIDQCRSLARFLAGFVEVSPRLRIVVVASATEEVPVEWEEIHLAPLSDEKIAAILKEALEGAHLADVVQVVVERARGVPAMVPLLVDALFDRGALTWRDGAVVTTADPASIELPDALDVMVEVRLRRCEPNVRAALSFGAVYGAHFSPGLVAAAAGVEVDAAELVASGLVEPHDGGLRFTRPATTVAVLRQMADFDVVRAHRRFAETIAEAMDPNDPAAAWRVAYHALEGGGSVGAARGVLRALALSGDDPDLADLCERAADVFAENAERLAPRELEEAKAFAVHALACLEPIDLARAERVTAELLGAIGSHAPAELARARVLRRLGRLEDATKALDRAKPDLGEDGRWFAEVAAVHEAGGRFEAAASALAEALKRGGAAEWELYNGLGRLYLRLGRPDEAAPMFDRAEATDHPSGIASARTNRAAILHSTGDVEGALELLDSARAVEGIDELSLARVEINRGQLLRAAGRDAEAYEALTTARRIAKAIGWAEGEALARRAGSA